MDHNLYTIIPHNKTFFKLSKPTSAFAYYLHFKIDLITGQKQDYEFECWMSSLAEPMNQMKNDQRIIHFFYESGFIFENLTELCSEDDMLAIDIHYSFKEIVDLTGENGLKHKLQLITKPDYQSYKLKFENGFNELKKGNFYQFNLTEKFVYQISPDDNASSFIAALWQIAESVGGRASATYIESLGKLFLSNSPESLFEFENNKLISKPIKGTMLRPSNDQKTIEQLWHVLESDIKSQAELFMITDLIRNDLNRIDKPTARVEKKKAMLIVPQLMHQYSEISLKLNASITLRQVVEKIFPGGSITGAPKKRVMVFLQQLEKRNRGFYCGSTLTFFDNKISASINIRSCEIDFNNYRLCYQSGGGITLLSTCEEEFNEITYKHDSFIDLLNP